MGTTSTGRSWRNSPWRKTMWGGAIGLLLVHAVATRFGSDVSWDETDFLLMGAMLAALCGSVELGARASGHWAFRAGVALAAVAVFLQIWINLAVGIIGSEDNPANLMFDGVIPVVVGGAFLARFQAPGMVRAMHAAAAAQVLVAIVAYVTGAGMIFPITAIFAAIWLGAAWLFQRAAGSDR